MRGPADVANALRVAAELVALREGMGEVEIRECRAANRICDENGNVVGGWVFAGTGGFPEAGGKKTTGT